MITSNSNQYLPPDYFSLPTTLDSKKSPLALLAQTCSQIGADAPLTKSTQDKLSKKLGATSPTSSTSSSRCSPAVTPKSLSKSYENGNYNNRDSESKSKTDDYKIRIPVPHKVSPAGSIKDGTSAAGCSPSSSPGVKLRKLTASSSQSSQQTTSLVARSHSHSNPPSSSPLIGKTADSISSLKSSFAGTTALSSMQSSTVPSISSTNGLIPGYPFPLDLMTSSMLHYHPLKTATGLNPYLGYSASSAGTGKIKGTESMLPPPVCRDPFCVSCQLSSHMLAVQSGLKPPCSAGCNQCAELKSSGTLCNPHLIAAYAQAQLAALAAASQMPYVCSWVIPETGSYCGKRFVTSDELLHHLRTHTSDTVFSSSSFLNRNYPSQPPLSPLTTNAAIAAAAASRYHPYSKSPFLQQSMFPFQANHSPLAANGYNPYLFYGSKISPSSNT